MLKVLFYTCVIIIIYKVPTLLQMKLMEFHPI